MAALSLLIEQGPRQAESVIDEDHLGRMTLGDRSLEREVLEIFARQTTLSLSRLAGAEPARAAAVAHTLKGSARGVGAWRVAQAAERLEQVASGKGDDEALAGGDCAARSCQHRGARSDRGAAFSACDRGTIELG